MTKTQEEVLDRIQSELGEHFDDALIVVTSLEHQIGREHTQARWTGTKVVALGLCTLAEKALLEPDCSE